MDSVIAKFNCREVAKSKHWDGSGKFTYTARFGAVTSNSKENEKFWAATPSGNLEMTSFIEDFFQPGEDYLLEFKHAPKEVKA